MIKRLFIIIVTLSLFAIPRQCDIPNGAYGVWQIPELDIAIPVYTSGHQATVDKELSAYLATYGIGYVLNDHADSETMGKGKWCINECKPDTKGFMVKQDGTTYDYTCIWVCRATRLDHAYVLDGDSLYPRRPGDIICASCATADASEVYLALFRLKGEIG